MIDAHRQLGHRVRFEWGPAGAEAYRAVADDLPARLAGCASGLELAAAGFAEDVAVASRLDVSEVVPVQDEDGAFSRR